MPLWSNEEWRARIGSSWCALGKSMKSKSPGSRGRALRLGAVLLVVSEVIMILVALLQLQFGKLTYYVASVVTCSGGPKEMDEFISHMIIRWLQLPDMKPYLCGPQEVPGENFSMGNSNWTVAMAMVTTVLLATVLVLAFLLLRCGDVETDSGPKQAASTVVPGHLNGWEFDCCLLIGVLKKAYWRNITTLVTNVKLVGNSINKVQHKVCIVSAIAIAILVSMELVTAAVQASLLLRCGDVEMNPGPIGKEELERVDSTSELTEDDLRDVREEVISIKTTYFELGIELGISPGNLETIRRESKSIDQACSKMLLVWLRQDYNVAKHGLPTWQRLVKAVDSPAGGSNSALAKKIAKKHPLIGTEECKDCSDPALVFCEQCDSYYCDTCSTSQHKHPKKRNHTITRLTNETQDDKDCEVCGHPASVSCEQCDCYYCETCSISRHKHSKRKNHTVTPLTSETQDDKDCKVCSDPASLFCEQCDSYYCETCSTSRHKHPKRKNHNVIPLASKTQDDRNCKVCSDPASLFCKQCDSHYCETCSISRHKHPKRKNHTITTLISEAPGDKDCEVCSDPASLFCEQCDSYYCETCSTSRHKHPKRRNHTVTPLTSETQDDKDCEVCSDPASVFCEDCDSYYCEACSTSRHKHPKRRNHTVTRLTSEAPGDKNCEYCCDPVSVFCEQCESYLCENCSASQHKHPKRKNHIVRQLTTATQASKDKHNIAVEDIAAKTGVDIHTLQSECSDEVLIEVAKIVVDWKAFGSELCLDEEDLDSIQQDKKHKKLTLILKKWKEKFGSQATNQTLIKVALIETVQLSYQRWNIGAEDTLAIHIAKIIGAAALIDKCCVRLKSAYLEQNDERTWPPVKATNFITLALINDDNRRLARKPVKEGMDEVIGEKEKKVYDEVVDDIDKLKQKFILFEGRPGSGKTTLMNKIRRDWATGVKLTPYLVIFVHLRRLNPESDRSLATLLKVACSNLSQEDIRELVSLLEKREGDGVVFAFDGLDEYMKQKADKDDDVYKILRHESFKKAIKIVSSRPAASSDFRQCAKYGRRVEVMGFLKAQVIEYIKYYFKDDQEKADKLVSHVEEHPHLRNMCYLPLHCAMLSYLYEEDSILPATQTEFYKEFTLSTLVRCIFKREGKVPNKLSSFDSLPSDDKSLFDNICQLAFEGIVASRQIFSSDEVRKVTKRDSIGSDSGLGLVVIDRFIMKHGLDESFTFLHLTFQEYLSAVHISDLGETEQLNVIRENSSKVHLSVVWKFLCGLMNFTSPGALDAFKQLIQANDKLLFKIQCAHESCHPLPCTHVISSLEGFLEFSRERLTPSDCAALGYVIKNSGYQDVSVGFDRCNISTAGAVAFLERIGNHQFSLKLADVYSEGRALKSFLQGLKKCHPPGLLNLHLDFSGKKIGDRGAQELVNLLDESNTKNNLQLLDLSDNNIGVNGFNALRYPNLQQLSLKSNNIGDTGARTIGEELKHHHNLKHLVLTDNNISDTGIKEFAKGLKKYGATLQTLELDENFICDDGAKVLGKSLQHCANIMKLVLGNNDINDDGVQSLGKNLQHCSKLTDVRLNTNQIGDKGAMALGEYLVHCSCLRILDLTQNHIYDDTALELRKMLGDEVTVLLQSKLSKKKLIPYC